MLKKYVTKEDNLSKNNIIDNKGKTLIPLFLYLLNDKISIEMEEVYV